MDKIKHHSPRRYGIPKGEKEGRKSFIEDELRRIKKNHIP